MEWVEALFFLLGMILFFMFIGVPVALALLKAAGQVVRDQRVVSAYGHRRGDSLKSRGGAVLHLRRLPVYNLARFSNGPTKRLDDGLMAKADARYWNISGGPCGL